MDTLSRSVARVLRREIADRELDTYAFAVKAGKSKSTGWRQVKGKTRMSIDDVEDFATALGWTLERLITEARTLQRADAPKPAPTQAEHVLGQLSDEARGPVTEALESARRARRD